MFPKEPKNDPIYPAAKYHAKCERMFYATKIKKIWIKKMLKATISRLIKYFDIYILHNKYAIEYINLYLKKKRVLVFCGNIIL